MSAEAMLANLVWFLVTCVIGLVVWRQLVLPNLRDSLRHRLFELRHDMFMLMANGVVSPDAPAYGHVRTAMNGWIRFASGLSFFRTVAFAVGTHGMLRERTVRFERDMARLDPSVQKALRHFLGQSGKAVAKYLVASSPLAWVSVPFVFLYIVGKVIATHAGRRAWDSTFTKIGAEGEVFGCIEVDQRSAAAA